MRVEEELWNELRFTRLTNAFSKKVENHEASIALFYAYFNFCRVHQTLRVTPAMEAGLTDHVWKIEELVALLEPKSILDGAQANGLMLCRFTLPAPTSD